MPVSAPRVASVAVIYQHPLAYLLAVEGAALLRAFAGEHDRDFTLARIAEVRAFVEAVDAWGDGVTLPSVTTPDGYRTWAETYDLPGNQLVDLEQPAVHEILRRLPAGIALDVACGTGRHARYLEELGHRVIGVDSAPAMLDRAAASVPGAGLARSDLHQLPIADGAVDVIVCALALSHVPDLAAALTEFVRVLRPGGHLVISDSRGLFGYVGPPVPIHRSSGGVGVLPHWNRLTSDYLAAALPLGLQVRSCVEPRRPDPLIDPDAKPATDELTADDPPSIWVLHTLCPAATNAAYHDNPAAIVWHFQLEQ
jgi:ubiquinone/menaquinone biosynthesis C-methylase UbiE